MTTNSTICTVSTKRYTFTLDANRAGILDNARPVGGSASDALRQIIDIAARASDIDRQNRDLATALTVAMMEMSATLTVIRDQLARLEAERR